MPSCRGHGLGAPDAPTKPQDPRNMASRGIGLFGPSGVGERRLCRAQNEKTCQKAGFSGLPGEVGGLPWSFKWCRHQESNPGPTDYKSVALPTELYRHLWAAIISIFRRL